jgi:hypothetical protein
MGWSAPAVAQPSHLTAHGRVNAVLIWTSNDMLATETVLCADFRRPQTGKTGRRAMNTSRNGKIFPSYAPHEKRNLFTVKMGTGLLALATVAIK